MVSGFKNNVCINQCLEKKMLLSILYISLLVLSGSLCDAQTGVGFNRTFQVGVILDFDSLVGRIGLTSLALAMTDFYATNPNYTTRLVLHLRDSKGQVIDAAANALGLLKGVEVDAIIGPQKSSEASFVIGVGDRANVPIISFSATSPSLHSKSRYFIQTGLSDAAQVGAIAAVVGYFHWNQVVLIYEDSDYGNGIVSYLANAFQDVNARVSYRSIIPLTTTDDFLLQELYKMKTMQTKVFVVHVSSSLASKLFLKVNEAGMMGEGYAWIVTSELMDLFFSLDSDVVDSMQGVLGVKHVIPRSRKLDSFTKRWKRKFLGDNPDILEAELSLYGLWAYDTLWALAVAAERVGFEEPTSFQINTSAINFTNVFTTEISKTGQKILEAMFGVIFQGLGGKFHIVEGQLEPSAFQILNVVGKGVKEVGIWTTSHGLLRNLSSTSSSNTTLGSIIFPGDTTNRPRGWEFSVNGKKLRVGVPVEAGFMEFVHVKKDPVTNATIATGCYIDIFEAALKALPYALPFEYVAFRKLDGSSAGNYNELTQQVYLGNFDAAVGDITITSNRSQFVEFTMPFAPGGITMTVPIERGDPNNKLFFLQPLSNELWLTAISLLIFTGIVLWILEHRFNHAFRGHQHAGMILYFPFMALVSAHSEKIVTNLARVVVGVWMFVVLILVSTYTASLSAGFTIGRLSPRITEANELIRSGAYVGCHNGSFIVEYLQHLGFEKSKIKTYRNPKLSEEALSKGNENGGIAALFSTRPYTNLFLLNYGDKYMTVGETYPTDGFAFVFPKGSPLVADFSRELIKLMDRGEILEIEKQWKVVISTYNHDLDGSRRLPKIELRSFKVLFAITGGINVTCLAIFVMSYLYQNKNFVKSIWSSGTTVWSKVIAICENFDQRDPKSFRDIEQGGDHVSQSRRSSSVFPIS